MSCSSEEKSKLVRKNHSRFGSNLFFLGHSRRVKKSHRISRSSGRFRDWNNLKVPNLHCFVKELFMLVDKCVFVIFHGFLSVFQQTFHQAFHRLFHRKFLNLLITFTIE